MAKSSLKKKGKARKENKPITYHIGNILMALSFLGLVFIYYPFIRTYVFPSEYQDTKILASEKGSFISIPKIKAQAPIVENIDPWDKNSYSKALEQGVAHAQGTSLPGDKGSSFLFAHSSDDPWNLTRFNTIFLRLGELESGDRIVVNRNNKEYVFRVREKKEVDPSQIQFLTQSNTDQLILQTCTPIGTALKRLLVFAEIEKDTRGITPKLEKILQQAQKESAKPTPYPIIIAYQ